MKMSYKGHEISEKVFDEIIKESLEREIIDGKDIITDEELEAMGCPLPPEDMLERIKASVGEEKAVNKKVRIGKSALRRYLIVAAIVAAIVLGVVMSVSGGKAYFFNIVSEINDNSIQFSGINQNAYVYSPEESEAYKTADETAGFTILKPTYLPAGFSFERIKIYPDDCVKIYYQNGDRLIKVIQTLLKNEMQSGTMVDINVGKTYTINAHDTKITIGEYERKEKDDKWLSAVWSSNKLEYKIEGDCSKSEFEEFIKKLK